MKALIWNIRSVRSQNTFQGVQILHNYHKFSFMALMELFQPVNLINRYRRKLRMPRDIHNNNEKIWIFSNHGFEVTMKSNLEQKLIVLLQNQPMALSFYITIVYAKCDSNQRLELWENLYSLSNGMDKRIIGGDFNVVLIAEEKIGGLPMEGTDYEDFKTCIESCDLVQVKFKGSPFT